MEKKTIRLQANQFPNPLEELEAERDRKIEQLKERFGQEKIVALLEAGFSKDTVVEYLENNSGRYSTVIQAVKNFLQAKALLEFHGVQSAEHIAAVLVAPITAATSDFPKSISIDDGVYIHGQVDASVTGKIDT